MQSLCRRLAVRASSSRASRYPSSSSNFYLFPRSAIREPSRRTIFTERRGGILGFLSESVTAKVLIGMLIGVGSGLFLPDLLDYIREDVLREREAYMKVEVQAEVTDRVFLDITVDNNYYGRIVIGLYGKECPKTVKNFISLAEGFELGEDSSSISKSDRINNSNSSSDNNSSNSNNSRSNSSNQSGDTPPVRLQYKGTSFFKIVPSFCLIGGDVINDDGTGGACIYDDSSPDSNSDTPNLSSNSKSNSNSSSSSNSNSSKSSSSSGSNGKDAESLKNGKARRPYSSFDDESCPNLKHLGLGVVSAAKNNDEGTNSKFFISVRPFPHLDDRNVVFGHVLSGYELILQLEKFGQRSGAPKQDVRIGDCGLLPRDIEHKSEI